MEVTRPFPFYVGQYFDKISFLGFAPISIGYARILDRREVGRDDRGYLVYQYRIDVNNAGIEVWVLDSLFARIISIS